MERDLYKRWRDHPLRTLLGEAQAGNPVYSDQLDDLRLPPKVRKAAETAIERCKEAGPSEQGLHKTSDTLSAELVDSLGPDHETRDQHQRRRADAGDADAIRAVQAREQHQDSLVEEVWQRTRNRPQGSAS